MQTYAHKRTDTDNGAHTIWAHEQRTSAHRNEEQGTNRVTELWTQNVD